MRLGFRQGFDPTLLSWGGPDEPAAEQCSICDAPLGEDDVPLIMWREDGWCVRLCDACTSQWITVVPSIKDPYRHQSGADPGDT